MYKSTALIGLTANFSLETMAARQQGYDIFHLLGKKQKTKKTNYQPTIRYSLKISVKKGDKIKTS